MSDPSIIIAELKLESGQTLTTLFAKPREFKTGSRGFSAHQKVEIEGKRYQVQVQIVEIGSKKTLGSNNG
jgi:hypothetical protein